MTDPVSRLTSHRRLLILFWLFNAGLIAALLLFAGRDWGAAIIG